MNGHHNPSRVHALHATQTVRGIDAIHARNRFAISMGQR